MKIDKIHMKTLSFLETLFISRYYRPEYAISSFY